VRVLAAVLALAVSVVGVGLFARAARSIVRVVGLGGPAGRRDDPGRRWRHLLTETLGHTRMLQWTAVGVAHWFVFVAFGALFFTLVTAYGQMFDPRFVLPVIGHWLVYEWASELIAWAGLVSILALIAVRLVSIRRGRASRFFGSRAWMGVYVELTILGIVVCVLLIRAAEHQLRHDGSGGGRQLPGFHDPVHEAEAVRFLGANALAGQEQVARGAGTDGVGQKGRQQHGHQADARLARAEAGGGGGDDDVARGHEGQGSAEGRPLDGGNHRFG
jgi:hypothetical protein